jgi:hypothetical protein
MLGTHTRFVQVTVLQQLLPPHPDPQPVSQVAGAQQLRRARQRR